ncbi:MAG: hypothetical protein ACKOX6_02145 [Bdellovibrio sp.]
MFCYKQTNFSQIAYLDLISIHSPAPPTPAVEASNDSVLYLKVATQWENGGPAETTKTCTVSSLSAHGEYTCSVSIPEGQLYYSNITFTFGTKVPALCSMIEFAPYYYRRSTSNTFLPAGAETEVDCSMAKPTEKKCYGGAAPTLLSDFPKFTGRYFLPTVMTETNYVLPSENTTRFYEGEMVNYLAANNLTNRAVTNASKDYIANTMTDYYFNCSDLWAHPIYSIKLTISDQDTATGEGVEDEIDDWD